MTDVLSRQTSQVGAAFLRKLIGFYKPKKFTADSTQFDMGYEQCKRDLRQLVQSEIQDVREYENFEPIPVLDAVDVKPEAKKWRMW